MTLFHKILSYRMKFTKLTLALTGVLVISLLQACKKDSSDVDQTNTDTPVTQKDKLLDSAMLYTRDLYLWYNKLPSNINQRSYADPNALMEGVRQYSDEPGFDDPVDRWSFAMTKEEWDNISSGNAADFGLGLIYREENDLRVTYVQKSSPAGKAGIRRGWKVTKINGNTNVSYTNRQFVSQNVYNSSVASFSFEKHDGAIADIPLTISGYQEDPIFLDSIYSIGSRKIGYLVFNSFLGDTAKVFQQFEKIFNRFRQQNVGDVIVDLRYNGGGYVAIQEKLANYLAPSSVNGGIMMKQQYNDKLSQYNKTTNFRKLGGLNLSRIFFIVSNNTASASELLINNLMPYMEVKLVGPSNTHGKPVGYFPYSVYDWYIFPVSFRTANKDGKGNYFNGIPVNNKTADGVDRDWGDVQEASLASAIKYITTGSFRRAGVPGYVENPVVRDANKIFDQHIFKGAIETRPK